MPSLGARPSHLPNALAAVGNASTAVAAKTRERVQDHGMSAAPCAGLPCSVGCRAVWVAVQWSGLTGRRLPIRAIHRFNAMQLLKLTLN